jgi:membrane-associated phospholipid phosphatase
VTERNDTGHRLAIGIGTLALTAIPARRAVPPKLEAKVFVSINQLPDSLFRPIWPVMQFGALAAIPVAAGAAAAAGQPRLSRRVLGTGITTWLIAKVVKRWVGRGRPDGLIPEVRVRGRAATGEGFLSGHAGIAAALATAAMPLYPKLRLPLAGLVATVGVSRVYVGAHLPLDVVGGVALGVTVDAAVNALIGTS